MARALELARKAWGNTRPNPLVGAVLVKRGTIIGSGFHRQAGAPHAEIEALDHAAESPRGAELFVTLEPCVHHGRTPPCVPQLVQAGLRRVLIGTLDPNPLVRGKGVRELRKAGLKVKVGLLEHDCKYLNESYFFFHEHGRPMVWLKWAMSLDGRTSTDSGESKWITGGEARQFAHRLRADTDAVMVGVRTILSDDPRLTVRLADYPGTQPWAIILDRHLRVPLKAACLQQKHQVALFAAKESVAARPRRTASLQRKGVLIFNQLRPGAILKALGAHELHGILIEGGRRVAGTFLQAGLVDKFCIFLGARLLGGEKHRGPLSGWSAPGIARAPRMKLTSVRQFGDDLYLEAYPED